MSTMSKILAKKKAAQAEAAGNKPAAAPKKILPKKAAPVEDVDTDEEEGEGEEAEAEATPAKKVVKKAAPAPAKKKAAPAAEEEGDEDEAEAPAKAPAKKANGKAAPAPAAKGGPKYGVKKKEAPAKKKAELAAGSWMPQDMYVTNLYQKLVDEELIDSSSFPKAALQAILKAHESMMLETLQNYDLKFLGVKSIRRNIEARVYAPNEVQAQVATPYHTLVGPHEKVTFTLFFNKEITRGTVDDDGDFVEGSFDAKGKFVPGTWSVVEGEKVFTPAKKGK